MVLASRQHPEEQFEHAELYINNNHCPNPKNTMVYSVDNGETRSQPHKLHAYTITVEQLPIFRLEVEGIKGHLQ